MPVVFCFEQFFQGFALNATPSGEYEHERPNKTRETSSTTSVTMEYAVLAGVKRHTPEG
jgi:hypothetical protein